MKHKQSSYEYLADVHQMMVEKLDHPYWKNFSPLILDWMHETEYQMHKLKKEKQNGQEHKRTLQRR